MGRGRVGAARARRVGPGLSVTLAPVWGTPSGGAERLWGHRDARGLAANDVLQPGSRLDAELGYRVGGPSRLGVLTPYAGLGLSGAGERAWRAGARWRLAPEVSLDLEGTLREAANDDAPEHGVMLRGSVRW